MAELGALKHPAIVEITGAGGPTTTGHRTPLNRYPGITTVVQVIYHRDVRSTHATVHVDRPRSSEGRVVEPSWSESENIWADKLKAIWINHIVDWLEFDNDIRLLIGSSSMAARALMSLDDVFAVRLAHEFHFEEAPMARPCPPESAPMPAPHSQQPTDRSIALSLVYSGPARLKLSQHSVATMSSKSLVVGIHDVEVGHPLLCSSWGYVSVGACIGSSRVFVPGALCTATLQNAKVSRVQDKVFVFRFMFHHILTCRKCIDFLI